MSTNVSIIRWLLVLPLAVAVWYICLIVGILSLSILDYFCPPELMISGSCQASWHGTFQDIFIALFASLSAVFIVISSAIVAPYKKYEVVVLSFSAGFLTALLIAYTTKAWFVFFPVSISGLITMFLLLKRLKKNAS